VSTFETGSEVREQSHADAAVAQLFVAREGPVGDETWRQAQRGLIYPAPHALFAIFWRAPEPAARPLTRAVLSQVVATLREKIHESFGSANTVAVVGVGFPLWLEWCEKEGMAPPTGMRELDPSTHVFDLSNGTFKDSGGDLWFHIKSDVEEHCPGVFEHLSTLLDGSVDPARTTSQVAATKATEPPHRGGKVLGCRFSENLNNPTDPIGIQKHTIVGDDDPAYAGASFVLGQRFHINWEHILNMGPDQIEDLVGRTTDDVIVPTRDDRSHIKCARVQDASGDTMRLLRLGLPFGQSGATDRDDLRAKGASRRDEQGIFFAGYASSVRILETIMRNQVGDEPGFMADRLLCTVRADLGGFFFIPSQSNLGLEPHVVSSDGRIDWESFPGVDWARLDRHFDQRSKNGYMSYNHHDYMHRMSTMSAADAAKFLPPSLRVLRLLDATFSRWQDGWYMDRKQEELEHASVYLERHFGAEKAREIMGLSIVERLGWAVKVGLGHVFASDAYGFRGRRRTKDGNWVTGADTYHIDPAELIVGGMPNVGLGQGKYVIDYAREDEKLEHFFLGLSAYSGVGHIVPGYQRLLDRGLDGLIADVKAKLAGLGDGAADKREFYEGVVPALEGVSDHCLAFAALAVEMAAAIGPSRHAERENLLAIDARMRRLAHEPPSSLLDAAQLIFTLHSCLHLIGEPTAIGRLDQLLMPYYARDVEHGGLDDAHAQEIIDCLWLKLGEKVLWNRIFVDDHKPFGSMAMGGESGNYPQGAANNQWVQQITVGGTVGDDASGSGTAAYNDVTLLCLRAARRLPFNAPCLSLRVRDDMPAEYAHEAALAILSGGAHPILLNDEKIIAGLVRSGDAIGDGAAVREKAGGRWRSEVPLSVARGYACDGCYEPQFVGKNWFAIGGLDALQVLEATLNQGKAWLTAGPEWFRGQRVSFTSPEPKRLQSFDEVMELYFRHLSWMYAAQVHGQLGLFGQLSAVCPSPLLSVFVDDCIDKGLDLYAGGARFNVIAPCFTALPNAINSLYAVRRLVFDPTTAVTSLPELVEALMCDWGRSMNEPFTSVLAGEGRVAARAERFRELRAVATTLPKYGRGNEEIDAFGNTFLRRVSETAVAVFTDPAPPTARTMLDLAGKIGTAEHPFGVQVQPGAGTFENSVEFGSTSARPRTAAMRATRSRRT